jgi:predicted esterase
VSDRAGRVAALVGAVRRHFPTASPPVVTGISQGGDLSLMLGVRYPTVIAAALPIASQLPEPLLPVAAAPGAALPPIDAFHGTADPIAPFGSLQRAVSVLRDRGFPVVLHGYPEVRHEVPAGLAADVRACAALRLRSSREPCDAPTAAR